MTDTLARPSSPARSTEAPRRSALHAGAVAAGWAAVFGLAAVGMPVLLVWVAEARSGTSPGDALRVAGQIWLLAHGAALELPEGRLALTPLGLSALPLALLFRAGTQAARGCAASTPREAAATTLAIAVPYAVLAAVVASASVADGVRPAPARALLACLLVAAGAGGAGAVRAGGLGAGLWRRLPARARTTLLAATGAVAVLLAGGALLAGASLARHGDRAADLAAASGPGVLGGTALLLLGLGLVPNAVIWGAAWLAGPGFAVGTGTSVSPFAVELGPVPALPLLAALPGGPLPTSLALLALLVPLLGGVLAGWVVHRRLGAAGRWQAAREAALAGPAAGLGVAVLALLSGGPAGAARMTAIGPSPWQVGLAVAAEVAAGAVAAAVVLRRKA